MDIMINREKNTEWLRNAKPGDRAILSNVHMSSGSISDMMNSIFSFPLAPKLTPQQDQEVEVCDAYVIHGHLPSDDQDHPGPFIVARKIGAGPSVLRVFTVDGEECCADKKSNHPILVEATDELAEHAFRLRFIRDIKNLEFMKYDINVLKDIVNLVNPETERINEEAREKE